MSLYQRGLVAPYRPWANAEAARVGMEHAAIAGPETPTPGRTALAFGLLALMALAVGGLWWGMLT